MNFDRFQKILAPIVYINLAVDELGARKNLDDKNPKTTILTTGTYIITNQCSAYLSQLLHENSGTRTQIL